MYILVIVLRLLHILGGVFWVGSALALNRFFGPTMGATGDAGKQFAGYLLGRTRFSTAMTAGALITVIAGFLLYGIDSAWFSSAWQSSGPGIGFAIGALFALMGLVTGIMNGNNNKTMARIGSQIQGKPTDEQAARLAAIRKQQTWVVPVNTYSLLLAVFFMAIARYLRF
jgi:uncharacterized membrane protein